MNGYFSNSPELPHRGDVAKFSGAEHDIFPTGQTQEILFIFHIFTPGISGFLSSFVVLTLQPPVR